MGINIRLSPRDGALIGRWRTPDAVGGLDIDAEFISANPPNLPPIPGVGMPDIRDPQTLTKLPPIPSRRVVVSLLGLEFDVGGQDWGAYVTSFDLARPMHGETQGVIELRTGRGLNLLNPSQQTVFKAGAQVKLTMMLPGQVVPLLLGGFIVEPPKFRIESTNIGSLSLRVGDIFLLKRQSETGSLDPYCGELPRTTSEAAQIFARVRGLPGVFGGEALVENINPDFIEGAPWDFLASLYEVLNFDVRTTVQGVPIAVPRTRFNPDTALVLESHQVTEAVWDSPQSLPFSVVPGYNSFNRSLGFRSTVNTAQDFSGWNAGNTEPWFTSNNTYTEVTTTILGDTAVQTVTKTLGYIPNNTVIPSGDLPGPSRGPCGEFIPAPTASPVSTRLDVIQTRTFRAYFEPHISGSYVVTGTEESTEGWNTYQNADGDTVLYFGQLEAKRSTYEHQAVINLSVCPQYWDLLRVGSEETTYARVEVGENLEPVFQLTSRSTVAWSESSEEITEGQVRSWVASKTSQAYDAATGTWVGGSQAPEDAPSPPSAQFINTFKAPVSLEVETNFPELTSLFGERRSKPVQFPNAFTTRELLTATERYARETAGLAYAIHLLVDPRVPIRPGAPIIYRRPGGFDVHGLAHHVEYNCTGPQVTQSVILMRTFTEPGFAAIRENPGFLPESTLSTANPCQ